MGNIGYVLDTQLARPLEDRHPASRAVIYACASSDKKTPSILQRMYESIELCSVGERSIEGGGGGLPHRPTVGRTTDGQELVWLGTGN